MGLKLKSTGGTGSVQLNAPDNHNTDTTITLPADNVTGGEFVLADGNGDVNIDSGTLFVDASADRVGINTTSPNYELSVKGSTDALMEVQSSSNNRIIFSAFSSGDNRIYARNGANSYGDLQFWSGTDKETARLDTSGRLLVGTNTFVGTGGGTKLQVFGDDSTDIRVLSIGDQGIDQQFHVGSLSNGTHYMTWGGYYDNGWNSDDSGNTLCVGGINLESATSGSGIAFRTTTTPNSAPLERARISPAGRFYLSGYWYNTYTTQNSANVFAATGGEFYRVSSSLKYKTDVETIQDSYSDAILNIRPVWYRSLSEADNSDHSWWGFIAEEVAEVDPRLVQWKTVDISYDENGSPVETPCDPEPEGVAYDRFVPHLLNLIKRQQARIETLETQNASFEARLAALEGGTTE